MSSQFSEVYNRLNPAQKKAVDTIDGPVMVVAGPGTGKTQVLAARIANILLKTDTNPSSVLALTFTDSAAKEMRERLVKMIGKTGYYVQISTFHSFCSEIIRSHPEYFPIDRGSEPLTDLERYDLFQQIIDEAKVETLKPLNRPYFYITDIMKAISNLKREGVLPTDFETIIAAEQDSLKEVESELKKAEKSKWEKNITKWQELLLLYQSYQQRLREKLRYDFDDMISLVIEAFSTEELLLSEYQENLHYFLVDEYQDTNTAQNLVVDLLASYWGNEANIFVVGDPNQAIYRFQGASVENVLGFVKRYNSAQVISLDYGYRCPQIIYDAAAHVIGHNQMTTDAEAFANFSFTEALKSQTKEPGELQLYKAPSQTLEIIFIAEEIAKLRKNGVPLDEIAVLYRHNRDAAELQAALDKWEIRYEIDGGDNLLEDEHIQQLLNLFQVIHDVRTNAEDERLYEVMLYEWLGLDRLLVMKLGRAAGKTKTSLLSVIEKGFDAFSALDIGEKTTPLEFEAIAQFVSKLKGWIGLDAAVIFPQWFETVIKESGYLEWIMSKSIKVDLLNHVNSLFNEVKALAQSNKRLKLTDFLQAIATMSEHGIALSVEDLNITTDAVHLSTVHRAKGREWSYVFMMHVIDGKWGNNRKRELLPLPEGVLKNTDLSKKEQNEDERRLFYVALTRAKKRVVMTHPETIVSVNKSHDVVSSMFLEELVPESETLDQIVAPSLVEKADEYLLRLLEPVTAQPVTTSTEAFFRELTKDFKLSVTALNTYLRTPQEFVENVLLKIPRAKPEPMAFGSAVHYALEKLFKHVQDTGDKPELKIVLRHFEEALAKELLVSADYDRRLAYGKHILQQYYEQLDSSLTKPLFIERFFGSGWSKTILDDIHLTGRIDRIDWLDTERKLVKVIDYKTGKEKSANYIEGAIDSAGLSEREQSLPEGIRGAYKRQLLFYKLLTELDPSFIPTATVGVFEFVEPNASGKIVSRQFELRDEDVNELKDLIREVMKEIRELKFLELV
jgi:DNA helicase II / ATP-dependent DNA helicase PcrA